MGGGWLSQERLAVGRQLDKYLETLYSERAGYVYVASKQANGGFSQSFFQYPDERAEITSTILSSVVLGEVYICPSLFAIPQGTKDQCLGSTVAWVDFDGNFPTTWPNSVPIPSMVVQTSSNRNVHAYWKLDDFYTASSVEEINRRLCYFFGADISGWDANQLLRPPETRNHKRGGAPVGLTTTGCGETYSPGLFSGLPNPPALPKNLETLAQKIPPIEEALAHITWPANLRELFENGLPEGKRHQGMFALAAGLAEENVAPQFILSVLLHSDNNAFHKFDKRPDQIHRITSLVSDAIARVKLKQTESAKEETPKWGMSLQELLSSQSKLEWLWEPYLHRTSCVILSGPPGVGKSLMTLSLAEHLVTGTTFLTHTLPGNLRVGFISLEMGEAELKSAVAQQMKSFTSAQMDLLKECLIFHAPGYPEFYSDKTTERALFEFVGDHHLDGVFIDSLSATTAGDLSSEKETKTIFELDARLRAKFGCFTWYIHHNRKAQADNKKPNKASDIFGSVHVQSKPTALITLWPLSPKNNRILFKPLKIRSAPQPDEFIVTRNEFLHYIISHNTAGSEAASQTTFVHESGKEEVDAVGSNSEDSSSDGGGMPDNPDFNSKF